MRVADQCDVVVIGAGPAGSAAAQLLAAWAGRSSCSTVPPRPSLAESLPASTRNPTTTASRRRQRSRPRSESSGG